MTASSYYRHRFEGRAKSSGRVSAQRRYMFGSHLYIPSNTVSYSADGLTDRRCLTLVRILYSQFNTCCFTAAIITWIATCRGPSGALRFHCIRLRYVCSPNGNCKLSCDFTHGIGLGESIFPPPRLITDLQVRSRAYLTKQTSRHV